MKDLDLDKIEASLGITLPPSYREVMLEYPVPAFVRNSDTYLWDDAEKLIEENKLLRNGAPGGGL